jgi:hypothetical protein
MAASIAAGAADAFTHASEAGPRIGGLGTSISAVLIAEACNTGFEPLVRPDFPALRRSRLSWIKHNYLRAETLIAANAKLVAAQNGIALAQAWGGGEVASAEGCALLCRSAPCTPARTRATSARGVVSRTTT